MMNKIEKTASTFLDVKDYTDTKYCDEIYVHLLKKYPSIKDPRISTKNFSALVVSRYQTMDCLINFLSEQFGKDLQVIELGAGFTPHFLNLKREIGKYIEIDYKFNSEIKKEIMKKLTKKDNLFFIGGDILSENTWEEVNKIIDFNKPVMIFCEGVVSHYLNTEQKLKLSSLIKPLLSVKGSCCIIDDTLKNHLELKSNPIIQEGMNRISSISGNNAYTVESSSLEKEINFWRDSLNLDEISINYILSKPEMDFAISLFRLIILHNEFSKDLIRRIGNLSVDNLKKRVWINRI
jgi:O-methyltransferase involved in polyketide biosynthesis